MIEQRGKDFCAIAELRVAAPAEALWEIFLDPAKSAEFFWGISFESSLKVGEPITWSGVWEGKAFTDRGLILELEKPRLFRYDYYSPLSGKPDLPEHHAEISYEFGPEPGGCRARIIQAGIATEEEARHYEGTWAAMLGRVKEKLEGRR